MITRRLVVNGVVQGVGFRPFVYRTAAEAGVSGSVCNLGDAGVEIIIEGPETHIERFLHILENHAPPLAAITSIQSEDVPPTGADGFTIIPSRSGGNGGGSLPPDVSICDACIADLRGRTRYADYWATSCTDCGPRFTVIEGLPYDRPYTSMNEFPMCEACGTEYTDPLDRRYHAQTIACPVCGPRLFFDGQETESLDAVVQSIDLGEVVAIKGIGGTHLACDAMNRGAVRRMRERLGRPGQPFAVMATEEWADRIACIDDAERKELISPRRPIVAVARRDDRLPDEVAPGLHTVGIMLPYTGLHVLLLDAVDRPLVMTSANRPGQPMVIENREIETRLSGMADHRLTHDRRIVARCDDSVVRRSGGRTVLLRRSRGYVPQPIPLSAGSVSILATGPESDLTFALYDGRRATLSQHIGTVDDLETYAFFQEAVQHLGRITGFDRPQQVACDLHPRFLTTAWAERLSTELEVPLVRVQHHVAHLAAAAAEHELDRAVGIVIDGYGYGIDGSAWGGEVFRLADRHVERVGSLRPVVLPGGDLAAKQPLRMVASFLFNAGASRDEVETYLVAQGVRGAGVIVESIVRGINAPATSSAGRFLDTVAAWLDICRQRTYEGEPAMRLEAAAVSGQPLDLRIPLLRDGKNGARLDVVEGFARLVELSKHQPAAVVAATAQQALAHGVADLAIEHAAEHDIDDVVLSGGVAYNDAIHTAIRTRVESSGRRLRTHHLVPCGDGCVSLGQVVVAGQGWSFADRLS